MSAAAISAKILNDCVAKYGVGDLRLADKFFSEQARFQRTPWLFAAGDDLRFPVTLGSRSASVRLFNWYRSKVVACSHKLVSRRLTEVTQFVRPLFITVIATDGFTRRRGRDSEAGYANTATVVS
jgi:hypothetical protein